MVDASTELSKPAAAAAPVLADDLCGNGDGGLLWCACAKIKAYRAREPFELDFGEPCLTQPLKTFLMGLP